MGLFGGSKSKKTIINEDNRVINDMSGSTFDNSVDNSVTDNSYTDNSTTTSFEDNSYHDSSTNFEDNSYSDSSTSFEDNSYSDSSTSFTDESYHDSSISGTYAGNTGSITITDGGAFTTVQNAVSDLVSMGKESLVSMSNTSTISLANMGKVAEKSMEQATLNNQLMRDITQTALQEMSDQASTTVSASTLANKEALAATSKLMTTVSANGNDLLIDGVVNIVKYGAMGVGGLGAVYLVFKFIGGNK